MDGGFRAQAGKGLTCLPAETGVQAGKAPDGMCDGMRVSGLATKSPARFGVPPKYKFQ